MFKKLSILLILILIFSGYKTPEPPKIQDRSVSEYLKTLYNKLNILEVLTTNPSGNTQCRYGQLATYNNSGTYNLQLCTASPNGTAWTAMTGGSSSSGYTTIQDEGSSLTQRQTLNFTGAGVTCVDNSGNTRTDCTIPTVTPGGSDTQVQFNDSGSFGGDSGFTFIKATDDVSIAGDLGVGTSANRAGIELVNNLWMNNTTATGPVGIIYKQGSRFIHNYGTNNVFMGIDAGNFTINGTGLNVAIGNNAMAGAVSINNSVAVGYNALKSATTPTQSVAVGQGALENTTTGTDNTAIGDGALGQAQTSNDNVAVGRGALENLNYPGFANTRNVAVGENSQTNNTQGLDNTSIGEASLTGVTDGDSNIAVGFESGTNINTGNRNTFIGTSSNTNSGTGFNNSSTLGYASKIEASNATSLGSSSQALGSFSTAIGSGSIAQLANTIVLDGESVATGASIIIGFRRPPDNSTFSVVGNTDRPQLLIRGYNPQTSDIIKIQTFSAKNLLQINPQTMTVNADILATGPIMSNKTTDIGWSIQTGANTACNTTCTYACVHGWDTAVTEVAVSCTDATADKCLCAGAN